MRTFEQKNDQVIITDRDFGEIALKVNDDRLSVVIDGGEESESIAEFWLTTQEAEEVAYWLAERLGIEVP